MIFKILSNLYKFILPLIFIYVSTFSNTFNLSKLISSYSQKRIVETAADHNGSLLFKKSVNDTDIINIIAFRVEFKSDTNPLTTGDGLFGMMHDQAEQKYYNSDTIYKFDALPHKQPYFTAKFEFVKKYFLTVSRGKLKINYSIYPLSDNLPMYSVPNPMSVYSPGYKKKKESWDEYYQRKTIGLMKFVADAIKSADKKDGPFSDLRFSNGYIINSEGHKTIFMIIHAGASFLTDGGINGSIARNSPSDMIDVFISKQFFSYFKDSLQLDTSGVWVNGYLGQKILIDEIMMCSETSNQDQLNFGIHGIMVNQIARQLGVPDLYSTSNGMTAVGGFCIMDPYGYSAANGFIPPWPSAWVRAFMGWDKPVICEIGKSASLKCKALCESGPNDTTIIMVPINDHEYYLIENRQRNLTNDRNVFKWDTSENKDTFFISAYSSVNLSSPNVVDSVSNDGSRSIISVKNYDVGIPASGLLVWHIDERIIRDRLKYNMINADSNYKAVCLEEADGVNDLGIMGRDIFYEPVFDFGGAEDIFPHFTKTSKSSFYVNKMGPWTKPSTHSNDGGQSFLTMYFDTLPYNNPSIRKQRTETYKIGDRTVYNYSDTFFNVSVSWDFVPQGWPKRILAEKMFEPLVFGSSDNKKFCVLSQSGRFYVWSLKNNVIKQSKTAIIPYLKTRLYNQNNTNYFLDTVSYQTIYYDSFPDVYTFPTVINDRAIVPSKSKRFYLISSASDSSILIDSTLQFAFTPSTYICKLYGKNWAVGSENGVVYIGDTLNYSTITDSVVLNSKSPVCAIAVLANVTDSFVCIQNNGVLSLVKAGNSSYLISTQIDSGIAPYSLVTADLNKDNYPEIVVCDSRKGIWVYKINLTLSEGWNKTPNDWPTAILSESNRNNLPINPSPPAIADINGDGYLDIIVSGSSGIYVLNYKGVTPLGWPAILDNRYWRGNIQSSPVIIKSSNNSLMSPFVIYHSETGQNETWEIDSIISVNKSLGKIVFIRQDGTKDSITGISSSFIDSALVFGDSLILPIVLPGGYIDALNKNGKRPLYTIGSNQLYSYFPLTTGASANASPLLDYSDNLKKINLFAVASNGWIYRWELPSDVIGDTIIWAQVGYNGGRSFAFLGSLPDASISESRAITFFSYPNPTNGAKYVVFKYKFSGPAKDVRLDIFTISGMHVFSKTNLSGSYPDFNELPPLSLETFAPGVYRCRLQATINGSKYVSTWKMAVVK
jgi:hypothetical protein